MSDKIQKLFSDKPSITKLCNNRVNLNGKCKLCFGQGIYYSKGDFYTCSGCRGCGKVEFVK